MSDHTKKISVMQLVHSLRMGGSEKVALDISSHLNASEFRSSVCALDLDGELARDLDRINIPHHVMHREGLEPAVSLRLYRLMKRCRPDVVHTHHFAQLFYAVLPARLVGARIVHTEHEFFTYTERRLTRVLLRALLPFCDRMTVVGTEVAEYFVRTVGISLERIAIIPNGVDVNTFDYDREAARRELGLDVGSLVIGTVGRLELEKDQATLLDVFRRIKTEHPRARLLIVGDGSLAESLKSRARQLGVSDDTLFLGYRRDVARLLAAMDIFVLPSIREGLPICLIEAMAARRPVIASDIGSVVDLVRDGDTGLVVPARDAAAFASAVQRLIRSPELRKRLADAGRVSAEASFSLPAVIRSYEALYRSAVMGTHVRN